MEIVKVREVTQFWAFPKDIAHIFGYKSPTKLLRAYREFCEVRPNYFKPMLPYREIPGTDTVYNVYCFAHYFENRAMLDAGTRSLNFEKDLPRIRDAYFMGVES